MAAEFPDDAARAQEITDVSKRFCSVDNPCDLPNNNFMHTPAKITAYINAEPVPARKMLKQVRALVRKLVPKASEKLAWKMPTFHLDGNLLHYAAFKNHMSIFPGTDAILAFKKELMPYQTSRGTIQFPYSERIPVGLISKIVKFCVKRNLTKAQAKKKKPRKRKAA